MRLWFSGMAFECCWVKVCSGRGKVAYSMSLGYLDKIALLRVVDCGDGFKRFGVMDSIENHRPALSVISDFNTVRAHRRPVCGSYRNSSHSLRRFELPKRR